MRLHLVIQFAFLFLLSSCSLLPVPSQNLGTGLSSSEIESILKKDDYVLISAGRNLNDAVDAKISERDMELRDLKLVHTLEHEHLRFYQVTGYYGVKEKSYLVLINSQQEEKIIDLAKTMKQESVILARRNRQKLVYVSGPKLGMAYYGKGYQKVSLKETDYFTEIKLNDGKHFRFSLDFDFKKNCSHIPFYFEGCHYEK